jgi:hypothetical protein
MESWNSGSSKATEKWLGLLCRMLIYSGNLSINRPTVKTKLKITVFWAAMPWWLVMLPTFWRNLLAPSSGFYILWICFDWVDEIIISAKETQTPPQYWQPSTRLHGVISQKRAIFIFHITVSITSGGLKLKFNQQYILQSFTKNQTKLPQLNYNYYLFVT